MEGGAEAAVMVKEKLLLTLPCLLSLTCTVKLNVPAVLGVPLITPLGLRLSPAGSTPAATDQEYGGVPPVADSVCEYARPTVPPGSGDVVVIESSVVTGLMTKVTAFDWLPSGFATITLAFPGEATIEAGTDACSCEVLTNVVCSGDPFQFTPEPARISSGATNPLPLTVRVNDGAPAVAELGLMPEIEGA